MSVFAIFAIVYIMLWLFLFALGIAAYVLQGLGMMGMAQSLNLPRPWLGFVPVASSYLLGQIAECHDNGSGKKPLPYRSILLYGNIAALASALIIFIFYIVLVGSAIWGGSNFETLSIPLLLGLISLYLLLIAIGIALTVFQYIAVYHIYQMYLPDIAVPMLILSIFVSVALPVIFFICRKKQPVAHY